MLTSSLRDVDVMMIEWSQMQIMSYVGIDYV